MSGSYGSVVGVPPRWWRATGERATERKGVLYRRRGAAARRRSTDEEYIERLLNEKVL